MTAEPRNPWHLRPWAIGLSALLAAIITVTAVVGSYAWKRLSALALIKEAGGTVVYESKPAGKPGSLAAYLPQWSRPVQSVSIGAGKGRAFEGLREFPEVQDLHLAGSEVNDADLSVLAGFEQLVFLSLDSTPVSDAGLAPLVNCRKLRELSLAGTSVGDEGLKFLVGLPLESLNLSHARVTDAGMDSISKLRRLRLLTLEGTTVGDEGIAKLKGMALSTLGLADTKVTDAGLAAMDVMWEMLCLELDRTGVGDAGLAALGAWPRLDMLALSHTQVTDAGLVHLSKLPLRNLDLSDTAVTDVGLESLFTRSMWNWLDVSDTRVTAKAAERFATRLHLLLDRVRKGQLTITRAPGVRPARWATRSREIKTSNRGAAADGEALRPNSEAGPDTPEP